MSKEQIIEGALLLEEGDRELLAERLLLSIDHSPPEEIERLWMEEIEKRLENMRAGNMTYYNGEKVLNELLAQLRK